MRKLARHQGWMASWLKLGRPQNWQPASMYGIMGDGVKGDFIFVDSFFKPKGIIALVDGGSIKTFQLVDIDAVSSQVGFECFGVAVQVNIAFFALWAQMVEEVAHEGGANGRADEMPALQIGSGQILG